ncbi:LamG-like jellyroll fold domain-containing protein [Reichenbachiella sp.]|uniref:LamG-like jellyroll fold domain-containing protein n=1 Tax=Reichenbachiella sp. TaxID=2184521 RepID=UPI003B5C77FE
MFKNLPSRGLRTLFLCLIVFVFGSGKLAAQDRALDLSGTGNSVDITYDLNLSGFTVETWVYFNDLTNGAGIFAETNVNIPQPFDLYVNNSTNHLNYLVGNGGTFASQGSSIVFNTYQWYHIAFVYDPSNSGAEALLYINGQLDNTLNVLGTVSPTNSTNPIRIGNRADNATNADAVFDDFRIWSDARTATEIADNFRSELVGNEANLDVYYNFNADNSYDIAGTADNGLEVGSVLYTGGLDFTLPTLSIGTVGYLYDDRFDFTMEVNKEGTLHTVALTADITPTSTQILAGTDGGDNLAAAQFSSPVNGHNNVSVTGLTPATQYYIYTFNEDYLGNHSNVETFTVTSAIEDIINPTLSIDGVSTPFSTRFDFDITVDEEVDVYYVVLPMGANAPSAAQIIAGTDGDDNGAIFPGSVGIGYNGMGESSNELVTGLMVSTSYDVYVVAQDRSSNLNESNIETFAITTAVLDVSSPTLSVDGGPVPTPGGFSFDITVNEECELFYVILASGSDAPNSTQILAGTDGSDGQAEEFQIETVDGFQTLEVGGLMAVTPYDVYIIAKDYSDNISGIQNFSVTTASIPNVSIETIAVPGASLVAGSTDNLIYKMEVIVSDGTVTTEGILLSPNTPNILDDFDQFNYYESTVGDVGYENATLIESRGPVTATESIAFEGDNSIENDLIVLFTSTYTDETVYWYITADVSATASNMNTFSIELPAIDNNFGIDGEHNRSDAGLAASNLFAVDNPDFGNLTSDVNFSTDTNISETADIILNGGNITVDGGSDVNFDLGGNNLDLTGGTFTNNGVVTFSNTTNISNAPNFINNGTIQGGINFTGNFTNSGIVSPGFSPSCMNVGGDYINAGIDLIEIEGLNTVCDAADGFDQIIATGDIDLSSGSSTLQVTIGAGYTPSNGDTFVILSGGTGLIGEYNNISGVPANWFVEYDVDNYEVTLRYDDGTEENALDFNGSSDFVSIPDFGGTQQMTIEMWVNATDITTTTHSDLIRQTNTSIGDYDYFIAFQSNATALRFYVRNSGGTTATATLTIADPSVFVGEWNHIAAVYDGTLTSNNVLLYVNGELEGTASLAGNLNVRNSMQGNNVLSGVTSNQGVSVSEYYNGRMDEVMIWDSARTPAEIRSDAENGIASPGAEGNLISYYKFNQGLADADNTTITELIDEKGIYPGDLAGFTLNGSTSNFVPSSQPAPIPVATSSMSTASNGQRVVILDAGNTSGAGLTNTAAFDATNFKTTSGTLEGWMRTTDVDGQYNPIVSIGGLAAMFVVGGDLITYQWGGTPGNISSGTSVADGNWHHVAFVYQNGVPNGSQFYVDGVPAGASFQYDQGADQDLINIADNDIVSHFFVGDIDEIRFWNRALTDAQILAFHDQEINSSSPGLYAYYSFNAGDGTDNSSNSFDGVVQGSPSFGTGPSLITGQPLDGVAPGFEMGSPLVDNPTNDGFDVSADLTENGATYYVVLANGASAPTSSEVRAGTGSGGSGQLAFGRLDDLGAGSSATVSGLALGTTYDVYFVGEDLTGNLSSPQLQNGSTANPTSLSPGDIAFTMMNADGDEEFAFLLKVTIDAGTEIHFTDHSMDAAGNKVTSEGAITFIASKQINAGDQVIINTDATNSNTNVTATLKSDGSVAGTAWESDVSWAITGDPGDQIFAFQGSIPGANLISVTQWLAAINTNPNGWYSSTPNNNESDLPSALTDGINAIALNVGEVGTISNNYVYDFAGSGSSGSLASMGYSLNDHNKWLDGNAVYDINDLMDYGGNTDATPLSANFGGNTGTGLTQSFDAKFFVFTDDDVADVINSFEITAVNLSGVAYLYYDANDDGMREVDGSEDIGSASYPFPVLITYQDLISDRFKIDITGTAPASGTFDFTNVSDGDNFDTNTYQFTGTIVENALAFDGDDYVEIQDHTDFELVGPFTIEFMYKTSASGNRIIFEKGTSNDQFSVQQFSGDKIGINIGGILQTQGTYNDGAWHHVAIVYRGASDGSIYVDGVDDTDPTIGVTAPSYSAANIHIGSRGGATGFVGQLDELRIWSLERSIGDIQANMLASVKSGTGLVAAYDFNSGNPGADNYTGNPEDHLEDVTGNNHDGYLDPEMDGNASGFLLNGTASNWVNANLPTCLPEGEFTGAVDGDWNDPANWCGDVPPIGNITFDLDITTNVSLTEVQNVVFNGNNVVVQGGTQLDLNLGNDQLQLTNGAIFTNNGTVRFTSANTTLNDVSGTNFINNGVLSGTFNTITPFTNQAGGTLRPGFSPGCMTFGSGYNDGGGTLDIEIAGATTPCTDFDQLQVTGTATLSGTLNVAYFGGYTPVNGHSVDIITATVGISGMFSVTNIPANWNLEYSANAVTLTYDDQGSKLAFDGNDYIVASEGGTDLSTSTIEMWVSHTTDVNQTIYWRGNTGTDNGTELSLEVGGALTYEESDGSLEGVTSTLTVPFDGTWTHIAVVKENDDVTFFVNGESETFNAVGFTGTPPSGEFTIGATNRLSGVGGYFQGQIDEVRIWNDKQADASIRTRATQLIASPTGETNLIVYYTMTETGNTSTVADRASGGGQDGANDATLNGYPANPSTSWLTSDATDNPQPVMKITEIIIDEDIPSGASSPGTATDGRNFGNVGQPSDTKTKVFEVRNDGVGTLNISQPTLTTGTNYSVINAAVTSFLPNESTTFSVVFAPTAVATYNETVNITNDYNTTYTFEVTGEGVDNNALNFGGTDDYVSIGSLGAFPAEGTIELWVNASDLTTNKGIFDTDINGNGLRLEVETGLPGLQIVADDDASQIEQLFSSAMSTSTWYHIAITWNTGTSNLVGYVNGVESFNVSNVASWPANLNDFVIGTALDGVSGPSAGRFWNGSMDELRIWNAQRDQSQISANMTNFGVDSETGLLASYDFNVGIAGGNNTGLGEPTLTDITTNTFDGTLMTFDKNGATSNYITSTVNTSAVPEITVESAGAINIDDNVAPLLANDTDYGYVGLVGETKTFTIRNDGLADLSISTITSNSADWIVSNVSETLPNELTSGNSMTFDLVMSPSGLGASNAAVITIANNDPDVPEQDFEIQTTVNVVENALVFDGTNDNISILDDDALSFGDGASDQPFSIEAWVNFNTLGINQSIVSKRGSGSDREYRLSMTTLNEIEVLLTDESAGGYLEKQTPAIPLGTGEWYHMAFTYDGSSSANGINIYLDGKLQTATPSDLTYTAMENTNSNLEFGQDAGLIFFDGLMDEVRIWDDVRSQSEIINNAGLTLQSATNLVASYDFNDGGTTNTLVDISGNSFDGTLGGFVLDGTAWVASTAFAAAAPDVNIFVFAGTDITDGDATPLDTDGTAFEAVSATRPVTQTFTVENEGVTPFNLTGVGSNNGEFAISGTTSASVGNSVTFDVTYQHSGAFPVTPGTQSATITATHNAATETPYDFAVSAELVNDYALDFDGVDDFIGVGNLGAFNEGTIEFWVSMKEGSDLDWRTMIELNSGGTGFRIEQNVSGNVYFWSDVTSAQQYFYNEAANGNTPVPKNKWHHIALSWIQDGANPDQVVGYFNGVEAFNTTVTDGTMLSTLSNVMFGATNGTNFLQGQLDEIRFWNEVRSELEIQNGMNTAVVGTESGLVAYYSFDNTDVTALANNSAVGNRNVVADKTGNYSGTASNFDMGGTPFTYDFGNTSNWVYSGAIASDIFVQDDLSVALYHGSTHEFGNQGITDPTPLSRTYTITNHGNGTLNLGASAISVSGGTDFTVSAQNGLTTLTAGQSTTFTIDFAPSTLGAKADNINITSDDPDEPTVSIAVNGIGVQGPAGVADGIVTWLRGEDAAADGSSWADFSGTGQNFGTVGADPSKANSAIGYQAGLVYTNSEYLQADNSSILGTDGYTKIVVARLAVTGTLNLLGTNSAGTGNHALFYLNPSQPSLYHDGSRIDYGSNIGLQAGVIAGTYDGSTNGSIRVNGQSTAGTLPAYTDPGNIQIGANQSSGSMHGEIAEVIIYNRELTAGELQEVESYLAAKYGINYSQDVVSSGSAITVWNFASGYSNDVVTIGRDDASFLDTRQVASQSSDIRFEIGHTSIEVDNATNVALGATSQFAADNAFLSLGHNGAASNYAGRLTANMPTGVAERMARTWLVNEPNTDITDVDLTIDMAGLNDWIGVTAGDYVLMIDDDGADWSNATIVGPSDYTSGSITFEGIDFDNGQFVSIGHGVDRALDFAGDNDYVNIGTVDIATGTGNYTKEAWIYWEGGNGNIISSRGASHAPFYVAAAGSLLTAGHGGNLNIINAPITANAWHHVAVTFDNTSDEMYLYIDGEEVAYVSGVTEQYVNEVVAIGEYGTDGLTFFNGRIDEVRIWNVARTATQIRTTALTPTTAANFGAEGTLLAGYDFNIGSLGQDNSAIAAPQLIDAKGTYHGTLNGFAETGTASNWVLSDYTGPNTPATTPSIRVYDADGDIISDNATDSPSTTNNTDFGTVVTTGANTSAFTYTIQNVGFVPANIGGDVVFGGADYSRDADITGPLAVDASDDVTITFDPSVSGVRGSSISFATDGIADGTYNFNVTGIGSASSSDIVVNGGFTPATGLDYNGQMAANIDREGAGTDGVEVAQFSLRDGGGSDDGDGLATLLDAVTVRFTNEATIQKVALYKDLAGTPVEVAEVAIAGTDAVFSGLAALPGAQQIITGAAGNQSITFSVVVTFANTTGVVDNTTDIDVTILGASTAAGAGGSGMNTGAADASETANNTLDVTADRLVFTNGPGADVPTNVAFSVTVQAHDANGNLDTNNTADVTLSEAHPGTLGGTVNQLLSAGTRDFNDLTYNQTQALDLTATDAPDNLTDATYSVDQAGTISVVAPDNLTILGSGPLLESTVVSVPGIQIDETTGTALKIFDISINDGAGGDAFNTVITDLVFREGAGVPAGLEDLNLILAGAGLTDGTNTITSSTLNGSTITINAGNITFADIPAALGTVTENNSKTYELFVWYRTDLAANGYSVDEEALEFEVDENDFTFAAGSSTIATATNNSGNIDIDVQGSKVVITDFAGGDATDADPLTNNILVSIDTDFAMTVEARDAYENIDLGYDGATNATLTMPVNAGNFITTNGGADPLTKVFSDGVVSWTSLQVDAVGTYELLVTESPGSYTQQTVSWNAIDAEGRVDMDPGFTAPYDIDYVQYDATDLDNTGDDELLVGSYLLVDEGGDGGKMRLADIEFTITNFENLDRLALYTSAGEEHMGNCSC